MSVGGLIGKRMSLFDSCGHREILGSYEGIVFVRGIGFGLHAEIH